MNSRNRSYEKHSMLATAFACGWPGAIEATSCVTLASFNPLCFVVCLFVLPPSFPLFHFPPSLCFAFEAMVFVISFLECPPCSCGFVSSITCAYGCAGSLLSRLCFFFLPHMDLFHFVTYDQEKEHMKVDGWVKGGKKKPKKPPEVPFCLFISSVFSFFSTLLLAIDSLPLTRCGWPAATARPFAGPSPSALPLW